MSDARKPRCAAALRESERTVAHRGGRAEPGGQQDVDKMMAKLGSMPRILCWKCRKLTPFELDRCQHCGSAFAGGTGGAYGRARTSGTISAPVETGSSGRNLSDIVRDLRRLQEVSETPRRRRMEKETSVLLYQCPSCGRFVSEEATECMCGVRFASNPASAYTCPECGSQVPEAAGACPVCGIDRESSSVGSTVTYACPRCGAHVASDAVRCSCGVWFED